ncbi:MAG: vancomycin high temperature exclusion protein [Myxococcaceae bacterium]
MPPLARMSSAVFRTLLRLGALIVGLILVASAYVEFRFKGRVSTLAKVPAAPVAIVFGAGLARRDEPSPILTERLDAAIALYRQGKVKKLLLTGKSSRYHDEVRAMRRYSLEQGIPETALVEDGLGLTTHESCTRARDFFHVSRAVLVTQRFHLSRALFIANAVGLDADGVAADAARERPAPYPFRELLARPLALVRVWAEASSRELPQDAR